MTKKGRPLSIRLGRDFEESLELEAERAGIPKTRVHRLNDAEHE